MNAEKIEDSPDYREAGPPDHHGLLHDLGHGLLTLSCLADSVVSGGRLPAGAWQQLVLLSGEIGRLLELVRQALGGVAEPRPLDVRVLLAGVAAASRHAYHGTVAVLPGEDVWLTADEVSLWRILTNLVDNAVRAAGRDGVVELSVTPGPPVVVTVTDTGPGFGLGPRGWAGRGLSVVSEQARANGALVRIGSRSPHGTCVQIVFARPAARSRAGGASNVHNRHR
jgi:signal transduction histidine kinase